MQSNGFGKKNWWILILFGLIGQIAWAVENMYFNLFVYETISTDLDAVTLMVQLSGVAATVTTLVAGTLSDKTGNRRSFISIGYIIWGLTVALFGLISPANMQAIFQTDSVQAVSIAVAVVIAGDCVMTLFGSTANDAAFNAWVTDNTKERFRGKVEGVLSILPLLSMLIVAGGFGIIKDAIGYPALFIALGAVISACGVGGLFLIQDSPALQKKGSLKDIVYGFKPSVVKANPALYTVFCIMGVYGVACQIFMPYLIIYMKTYLGFSVLEYSVVFGLAIALGAVINLFLGVWSDKKNKAKLLYIALAVMSAGLLGMYFAHAESHALTLAVFGAFGFVMITGYIFVSALCGAIARDYTPESDAGKLQGVRMIFNVLIPMLLGPFIGNAINKRANIPLLNAGADAMTTEYIPVPAIFLAGGIVALLALLIVPLLVKKTAKKTPFKRLPTDYETGEIPHAEHPCPQCKRESWLNLNGKWSFYKTDGKTRSYEGEILVPFSPETLNSGVEEGFVLHAGESLVYTRKFRLGAELLRGKTVLRFGAVDSECEVFVNGEKAGGHTGGFTAFALDITALVHEGENEVRVHCTDEGTRNHDARGKQSDKRGGIWYTPQSGIWQTVWIESMPKNCIGGLKITPNATENKVKIRAEGGALTLRVYDGEREILTQTFTGETEISHPFELWSPENPKLYPFTLENADGDKIESYFAVRSFGTGTDEQGIKRLTLNGKAYFFNGVLDQGYWSDGMLTYPSDASAEEELRLLKAMGFNTVRKHIKIEPMRWYYHCDRLGLVVWQDFVNGGGEYSFLHIAALPFLGFHHRDDDYKYFARENERGRYAFMRALDETVEQLYNCPCIGVWVPFNEGWGQFDSAKVTAYLREKDDTRIIDSVSGWHDQGADKTELLSLHTYYTPLRVPKDSRPVVLSEFGGYSMKVDGHIFAEDKEFGYKKFQTEEALVSALQTLFLDKLKPLIGKGLCASIYTQVSDVEEEINGLVTYDRKVVKVPVEKMRAINDEIFAEAKKYENLQ